MKLRVTNTEREDRDPSEYIFEQDRVTIGRGSDNDLTLADPKRIVSSEHAEVRHTGRSYQLVDRGSKNFTYLRGQRLTAGEPYALSSGDVFRIGEFEIEFVPLETEDSAPAADETVFAADFSNPFVDPAQDLLEALNDIIDAYEDEVLQRRDDALRDALRRSDAEVKSHEAVNQVLDLLDASRADTPGTQQPSAEKDEAQPAPATPPPNRSENPSPSSKSSTEAGTTVTNEVLDTLLEALARIIEIPWQFRHEFIGQTIMQAGETRFLYDGDAATMKTHLLDPTISQEERQKRLSHVEDAAEALAVHQVAMLNGYKASVMKGAEELLEQLNPDAHQAELAEKNVVFEYLPLLASPAVLDRLRTEWHDLKRGDWSAAEQRIFRPAFIKAYLARMTAADPSSDEPES